MITMTNILDADERLLRETITFTILIITFPIAIAGRAYTDLFGHRAIVE